MFYFIFINYYIKITGKEGKLFFFSATVNLINYLHWNKVNRLVQNIFWRFAFMNCTVKRCVLSIFPVINLKVIF